MPRNPVLCLLALPLMGAPADRELSPSDGNFELTGTFRATTAAPVTLRFRAKSGFGYRIRFNGPGAASLDDPGRRPGTLATPDSDALAGANPRRGIPFKLVADGPAIRLEWNGKPAWNYTEKEAGIYSAGAVRLEGTAPSATFEFRALPATPPSFSERYGPGIGAPAPPIEAVDQTGKPRNFANLRGPKGLWILFVRSADW